MAFVLDNQLVLLVLCFLAGSASAFYVFRKPTGHAYWKFADLVWVVLGGFGALVTIFAGFYQSDSSQINRKIDVAYVASSTFYRDAARFHLRYCDPISDDADVLILCDKVEFLSASTANNSALPLFISIAAKVAPRSLNLFGRNSNMDRPMSEMAGVADEINLDRLLVFQPKDENTERAVKNLRRNGSYVGGDFSVLAEAYSDLVSKVALVRDEWEYLQSNAHILVIRIIALCLIAFAAPFRLGKSVVELLKLSR